MNVTNMYIYIYILVPFLQFSLRTNIFYTAKIFFSLHFCSTFQMFHTFVYILSAPLSTHFPAILIIKSQYNKITNNQVNNHYSKLTNIT